MKSADNLFDKHRFPEAAICDVASRSDIFIDERTANFTVQPVLWKLVKPRFS